MDRARSAMAGFGKLDVFVDQLKELENMLLPDKGNLEHKLLAFLIALESSSLTQ